MGTEHSDAVKANQLIFDSKAATYGTMSVGAELAKKAAAAILRVVPLNEETSEVLEFGCGIGLVSQEIASHTKSHVGIDVSEKSVEMFNESVSNQGIDPSEMQAFCLDVFDTKEMEAKLGGRKFDLVYSSMTYHHVKDVVGTTKILAGLAKPGGHVVLVDLSKLERYEGKFHGKDSCSSVMHHGGFTAQEFQKILESSGLVDVHVNPTAFTLVKALQEKHNHGGCKGHTEGERKGDGKVSEEEFEFLLGQGRVPA